MQFLPGSVHTATVTFINTKDVAINYEAELYLVGVDGVVRAASGLVSFSIAAGASKDVGFSGINAITMPETPGSYTVWLDVYINGTLNVKFLSETPVSIISSFGINLLAGWNLISLPLIPDSNNIIDIINSNIKQVYWYDSENTTWHYWSVVQKSPTEPGGEFGSTDPADAINDLTTMEVGRAYWLYIENDCILTVYGVEAERLIFQELFAGWNMVGFTSMTKMTVENYLANLPANCEILYRWVQSLGIWQWWHPFATPTIIDIWPGDGLWAWLA